MIPHRNTQMLEQRLADTAAGVDERLVSLVSPASFPAEQYRALRHLVEEMRRERALQIVAVTSPSPGDGKTTTAINLAGALAQASDLRVLLVEADLRRTSPTVADRLALDAGGPGLADAIVTPALSLADVVRRHPRFPLSVCVAGKCPIAYYEILKSPRLGTLLDEARRQYDFVVVDTPPVVAVPDCRVISHWIDGFLVVVAAHRTPLRLLDEALTVLSPAKIAGFVFNGDDSPLSAYSGYGSGYYGQPAEPRRAPRWLPAFARRTNPVKVPTTKRPDHKR